MLYYYYYYYYYIYSSMAVLNKLLPSWKIHSQALSRMVICVIRASNKSRPPAGAIFSMGSYCPSPEILHVLIWQYITLNKSYQIHLHYQQYKHFLMQIPSLSNTLRVYIHRFRDHSWASRRDPPPSSGTVHEQVVPPARWRPRFCQLVMWWSTKKAWNMGRTYMGIIWYEHIYIYIYIWEYMIVYGNMLRLRTKKI